MKKKNWQMPLCVTLLCLNIAFIWVNSLLPQAVSAAFSRLVGLFVGNFLPEGMDAVTGEGQGLLRKIAHFTEFFSLGLLLLWQFRQLRFSGLRGFLLPLGAGVAVACIDETIQLFNPGRGPGILDVAIDASGVLTGICLGLLIGLVIKQKKNLRSC